MTRAEVERITKYQLGEVGGVDIGQMILALLEAKERAEQEALSCSELKEEAESNYSQCRDEVARLQRANAEAQMANGFYSAALERIFTTPHNGDEASKRMCAIAQRAINTVAYTGTAPLAGDGGGERDLRNQHR